MDGFRRNTPMLHPNITLFQRIAKVSI